MFRLIANIIFLLASGALFLGLVRPAWEQDLKLKNEKESLESALANIQQIQELRNEKLEDYNSISLSDKERFDHFLPLFENKAELIIMFENLVKSNGLFLKQISILEKKDASRSSALGKAAAEKKTYSHSLITLVLSGPYESFKNFLDSLEKSLRIIDVENISFSSNETGIYEFNIKGSMYWYSPQKKINIEKISDFGNKSVLELLSILQTLKLNVSFFQKPSFKNLIDFYKKVEVSEEEVGRVNPFKPL
jgi:Tfp pilus assembly protein PilO